METCQNISTELPILPVMVKGENLFPEKSRPIKIVFCYNAVECHIHNKKGSVITPFLSILEVRISRELCQNSNGSVE